MAVARLALTSFADGEVRLSDEVELYQRTYTTLLRSSGETQLRVLEPSHMAMGSSLHPLAASEELDLGRLPVRGPTPAGRDRRRRARGDGPGRRAAHRQRRPGRVLAGGRGPRPPAPVVRQRRRHARGAAGQLLGRRRPGADAGRLPDRVEQDPGSAAGCGLAVGEPPPTSRRRSARASSAAARTTGRGCATRGARASGSACG